MATIMQRIAREDVCVHPSLETAHGECDLCYGGIEHCPDCSHEEQTHERHCPRGTQALQPLAIRHWKQIPYKYRQPGAECPADVYGVEMVSLRGGNYAVYAAANGLTPAGEDWIANPLTED